MTYFPSLTPGERRFEPPTAPTTQFVAENGRTITRLWLVSTGGGGLELEFPNVIDQKYEDILNVYDSVYGENGQILLPAELLKGVQSALATFVSAVSAGLQWAFVGAPEAEWVAPGVCTVRVRLRSRRVLSASAPAAPSVPTLPAGFTDSGTPFAVDPASPPACTPPVPPPPDLAPDSYIYLSRLSDTGYGGSRIDTSSDIMINPDGTVVAASSIILGPGGPVDILVVKYGALMDVLWQRRIRATLGGSLQLVLCRDGSGGFFIIVKTILTSRLYICRYGSDGSFSWGRQWATGSEYVARPYFSPTNNKLYFSTFAGGELYCFDGSNGNFVGYRAYGPSLGTVTRMSEAAGGNILAYGQTSQGMFCFTFQANLATVSNAYTNNASGGGLKPLYNFCPVPAGGYYGHGEGTFAVFDSAGVCTKIRVFDSGFLGASFAAAMETDSAGDIIAINRYGSLIRVAADIDRLYVSEVGTGADMFNRWGEQAKISASRAEMVYQYNRDATSAGNIVNYKKTFVLPDHNPTFNIGGTDTFQRASSYVMAIGSIPASTYTKASITPTWTSSSLSETTPTNFTHSSSAATWGLTQKTGLSAGYLGGSGAPPKWADMSVPGISIYNDGRTAEVVSGLVTAGRYAGFTVRTTTFKRSGKWYFEVIYTSAVSTKEIIVCSRISDGTSIRDTGISQNYMQAIVIRLTSNDIYSYSNLSPTFAGAGWTTPASGSTIRAGVAIDFNARQLWVNWGGNWRNSGNPVAGLNPTASAWTTAGAQWFAAADLYDSPSVGDRIQIMKSSEALYKPTGFSYWDS